MLEVGIKAPDFELPDQNGDMHKLSDYLGKKVILYFYPKDNTPGCTKQACGFSELFPQFNEKGAVILGVSKDSIPSHKKFEEKYGYNYYETRKGQILRSCQETFSDNKLIEIVDWRQDRSIKNMDISTKIINDLCRNILNCRIQDIAEYIPSKDDQAL